MVPSKRLILFIINFLIVFIIIKSVKKKKSRKNGKHELWVRSAESGEVREGELTA